jgi:hypothetical protein
MIKYKFYVKLNNHSQILPKNLCQYSSKFGGKKKDDVACLDSRNGDIFTNEEHEVDFRLLCPSHLSLFPAPRDRGTLGLASASSKNPNSCRKPWTIQKEV